MNPRGKRRLITSCLALLLVVVVMFSITGCKPEPKILAQDLMAGITANEPDGRETDSKFIDNMAHFSIEIFKRSAGVENSLVSPLSVMLALAMTANGADGETLTQMERVLGGSLSLQDLNEYLYTYAKKLPNKEKSKLAISNSIWFRDHERFSVNPSFLQTNADYYGAEAYKAPFDAQTLKDINNWVKDRTDGMISEILKEMSDDAVMFLLNAIVFDAEWEVIYKKSEISKGQFTNLDGSKAEVDMMSSEEMTFIRDDKAKGFIKPYKNGDYSFVAILPDEAITVTDYIASMTGESFTALMNGAADTPVSAIMPKFSYDFTIKMNEILKDMGMVDAFSASSANFNRLGESARGNLYIHEVIHKTYISVDEKGTRAGAVTKVEIRVKSAFIGETVVLDRPFVYAIVDNATNLPVFIGVVTNLSNR